MQGGCAGVVGTCGSPARLSITGPTQCWRRGSGTMGRMGIPAELWPLSGLRLVTGRLELRVPREGDLVALAELATAGVHDPEVMPFSIP